MFFCCNSIVFKNFKRIRFNRRFSTSELINNEFNGEMKVAETKRKEWGEQEFNKRVQKLKARRDEYLTAIGAQ